MKPVRMIKTLALLAASALFFTAPVPSSARAALRPPERGEVPAYRGGWTRVPDQDRADRLDFSGNPARVDPSAPWEGGVEVPADGGYRLLLRYRAVQDVVLSTTMRVSAGGKTVRTRVVSLWEDGEAYPTDRFGNELPAAQRAVDAPVSAYVYDQSGLSADAYVFQMNAGRASVRLECDVPVDLYGLELVRDTAPPPFSRYISEHAAPDAPEAIIIEGERYSAKSESSVRGGSVRNAALSPYDYRYKSVNILDASSFNTTGQKVLYTFNAPADGLYSLSFLYAQDYKENVPTYADIEIDGEIPFAELKGVAFPYTGTAFGMLPLTRGNDPLRVFLEKGTHTLAVRLNGAPCALRAEQLEEAAGALLALGLEIKKIAGEGANGYRTWDVEKYVPGALETMERIRALLEEIYGSFAGTQREKPAALQGLLLASQALQKLLGEPSKIPARLSMLSEGSGSAAQHITAAIDKLKNQSLSVDRIFLHPAEYDLPAPAAGFFRRLADGVKRLFYAFGSQPAQNGEGEALTVWMNRPIQYVETLQAMADVGFTAKTGVRVDFSVMPSEQRIILSNASKTAPDVVMGVNTNMPYDLGLRGAAADLAAFPDFYSYMEKEYHPQSLVPYTLGNQVFGVTETQEFFVLIMRDDIMGRLKLAPPQTWSDIAQMMPVLRRNSMNFYLQLSGYSGTKPLYATAPFLMQAGASLYAQGGLKTGVASPQALAGFKTLTDLYRLYSVPQVVSSFYNSFRYGDIPAGIGSFGDYMKIMNAAPEIAGLWSIAPAPGFQDENGRISRGTTAASTACAVLEQSARKDDAWAFLKWWLSAEVQESFGNTMQTTYGPDYLWNTANRNAFSRLAFPEQDRKVILAQWEQMAEIPRHPALYAIERELSNAWAQVVLSGKSPRIALNEAEYAINLEFSRKLLEFGFIHADGRARKTPGLPGPREGGGS